MTFVFFRLTTGLDNVLFHYVSMDWARGVFISPTSTLTSQLHEAMLDTFGRTCVHIRQTLFSQEHDLQVSKICLYPFDYEFKHYLIEGYRTLLQSSASV